MEPYSKIDTLFKRDDTFRLTDEFRHPYLIGDIARWIVEEKVDGTNLRLIYDFRPGEYISGSTVIPATPDPEACIEPELRGRSNAANINKNLKADVLANAPPVADILRVFGKFNESGELIETPDVVTLYGEGIGPSVAGGGPKNRYQREHHEFILFDVKIGTGQFGWLHPHAVQEAAQDLAVMVVPHLSKTNLDGEPWCSVDYSPAIGQPLDNIIEFVRKGFASRFGGQGELSVMAEGIIAKPRTVLFDNRGKRVIVKLKTEDFKR